MAFFFDAVCLAIFFLTFFFVFFLAFFTIALFFFFVFFFLFELFVPAFFVLLPPVDLPKASDQLSEYCCVVPDRKIVISKKFLRIYYAIKIMISAVESDYIKSMAPQPLTPFDRFRTASLDRGQAVDHFRINFL